MSHIITPCKEQVYKFKCYLLKSPNVSETDFASGQPAVWLTKIPSDDSLLHSQNKSYNFNVISFLCMIGVT